MTRIFTPEELIQSHFPESVEKIRNSGHEVNRILEISQSKGDIIGATSYGSLYGQNTSLTRTSDIDWLIVFQSIEAIFSSEELKHIIRVLNTAHIGFSSPVLSLESIESNTHLIGPIQMGIRNNIHRVIIGRDPIDILAEKQVHPNNIRIIDSMFSSYPRYFYESIFTQLSNVKDVESLAVMMQKAVDYFTDMYRTMIVLGPVDGTSSPILSYGMYKINYSQKIGEKALAAGEHLHSFINQYKSLVEDVMSELLLEESAKKKQELVDQYKVFLIENVKILINAIIFCQKNIEYFDKFIKPTK